MTIALDVVTTSVDGSDASFSHLAGASVQGVVGIWCCTPNSKSASSMTYAATELTDVADSPFISSTSNTDIYCALRFQGSSVSGGTQTFTVANNGNPFVVIACITLTAAADIVEQDTATIDANAQTNPSATLSLGGNDSFCCIGFGSGWNTVADITPFANWTDDLEVDAGTETLGIYTYDTIASTDVAAGWTQGSDAAAMLAAAFTESVVGGPAAAVFGHNQFHNTLN